MNARLRAWRPLFPYFALALALVGLGLSPIFVRWANAPGPVSGFYRMALAAALMFWPFQRQARRTGTLSGRHVALAILAGLLFAGDLAAWNTAVLVTSAASSTLLGNTSPIWVGLGAWLLFREKLGPLFWLGLALALAGAVVILGSDFIRHPNLGWGDLLSVLAGFFYGAFFLATQRAREQLSALSAWWISAAASTLALLGLSLALGQPLWGYSWITYLNLAAIALVTQVGSYLLINYALGHLPASIVSPSLLAQPVLAAVLAVPLLGERLSGAQMLGGLAVLGGIWLIHRQRHNDSA